MSNFELRAEPRSIVGKKVRFLRRQGMVPGNVYGHAASAAIQIPARDVEQTIRRAGRTQLVSLAVKGAEPTTVLVKGWQRHPYKGDLLHVDFYRVLMTETLRMDVPIRLSGEAPAVKSTGGVAVSAAVVPQRRVPAGRHPGGDRRQHQRPRRGRRQHLRARSGRSLGRHDPDRWRRDGREDHGANRRARDRGDRCRRDRRRGRRRADCRGGRRGDLRRGVLTEPTAHPVDLPDDIERPREQSRGFVLVTPGAVSPARGPSAQAPPARAVRTGSAASPGSRNGCTPPRRSSETGFPAASTAA